MAARFEKEGVSIVLDQNRVMEKYYRDFRVHEDLGKNLTPRIELTGSCWNIVEVGLTQLTRTEEKK